MKHFFTVGLLAPPLRNAYLKHRSPMPNGTGKIHRRLVIVAVMALTLLAFASNALASGPERVADGPPPVFTDATCGFPLNVQVVANRELATTWIGASGAPVRTIITGTLKVVMTNPANGMSATLNISGPAVIIYNADGTATQVSLGRAVIVQADAGQLILSSGRVIQIMPSGTVLSLTGRSLNLCNALR